MGSSVATGGAGGDTASSGTGGSTGGAGGAGGAGAPGAGGVPGTGGAQGGSSTAGAGGVRDGGTNTGSGGAGGIVGADGGLGVGAPCASSDACKAPLFCKKMGCTAADVLGKCAARPQTCPFLDAPACGCDGITYLSSCLAELNGQNWARGICGDTAVKCTSGDKTCDIRPNGYCAVMLTDQNACGSGQVQDGKCWVVASDCVPTGSHFDSCDGNDKCVHSCDVAKSGKPHYPNPNCGG